METIHTIIIWVSDNAVWIGLVWCALILISVLFFMGAYQGDYDKHMPDIEDL